MRRVVLFCMVGMTVGSCRFEQTRPEPVERKTLTLMRTAMTKMDPPVIPVSANETDVSLPMPQTSEGLTVSAALAQRRSRRDFAVTPLDLSHLAQLAWAAQGITEPVEGLRTAPSAGALYPLELYFVTAEGVLHYRPKTHTFQRKNTGDLRERLSTAALGQAPLRHAPCSVVITSVTARTSRKYGARASRYVALEAGHAAQNLLLEATSRHLVGVPIGAFDDAKVAQLLALPSGEDPLYLVAIGHPRQSE